MAQQKAEWVVDLSNPNADKITSDSTTNAVISNKQSMTAVEWLLKELEGQKLIKLDKLSTILFNKNFATRYELIIYQAKAMEKQQIIKSRENGISEGYRRTNNFYYDKMIDSEEYYNKTFKLEVK